MKTYRVLLMGMIIVGMMTGVFITEKASAEEGVTVGFGSLKIGGIYQSTFTWFEYDDTPCEFKTQRAMISLSGTLVPDKIKYLVQANAIQSPILLDSKLMLYHIPNTELSIGRFLPFFTLFMPKSAAQQDFIKYPLTTSQYAMWRQTGVQFKTTIDSFSLYYGVFNGYQFDDKYTLNGNDWGDQNDAKDFLLSATFNVNKEMKIGAFGWFGKPYIASTDEDFTVTRFGANFEWRNPKFHAAAEYIMGNQDYGHGMKVKNHAAFVQGGFSFVENWELLARYEIWDPNKDVDKDGQKWFTAGLNYSLEKHYTKFFLNYVAKMEEVSGIDNDEIVFQVQFSF
ncbi:MAG: hypothetical protein WBM02_05635 [bacterium]